MARDKIMKIKKNKGIALITVMVLLVIMTILGLAVLNLSTIQIRGGSAVRKAVASSISAGSGIFAVSGWMVKNRSADVPKEIKIKSGEYETYISVLDPNAVLKLPGYSTKWRGMVVRVNSSSPNQANEIARIEGIVFVPVTPVGYGNEPR